MILNAALYFYTVSYGTSLADSQNITLVHEEMHIVTNLDDIGLANLLQIGVGAPPGMSQAQIAAADSVSIASWLAAGCPQPGGNH